MRALGRAFAATLAKTGGPKKTYRVAVGYDGRLTSPELEAALVDGLAEGGADVTPGPYDGRSMRPNSAEPWV